MPWRRLAVALAVLLLLAGSGLSVGASGGQDDAGSGRDAGDTRSQAVPVTPGTYNGTISGLDDDRDYYSFRVEKGQRIRFRLAEGSEVPPLDLIGPSGQSYSFDFDGYGSSDFLAHKGGTWYLRAGDSNSTFSRLVPTVATRSYRFSFSLETPEHVVIATTTSRWQTLELSWDEDANVTVYAWKAFRVNDTRPLSTMLYLEDRTERNGDFRSEGYFASHLSASSWSRTVEVEPGPVPERNVTVLDGRRSAGWEMLRASYRNRSASVRTVAYTTVHETPMVFAVASDVPVRHASATGSDVVAWNEYDDAPAQVLTPAASVTSHRERVLPVDGLFYGFFTPWEWTGTREDPDGDRRRLYPGDHEFLIDPAHGNWTFGMSPTVGATGWTVRNYLDGVHIPWLGVAPRDIAEFSSSP